ncbi:hypothetical protein RvY_02407 [Ramazzottius varieornatus]|uniref:Uncharacterized protein n=1 Tax=Ramazzottius varieornatus TaxID=947166 RepID=A0A1D1UU53_RAMVA|nr:hypothetical protein RvY_02407 [Ramazzottius varieornatus]
MKGVQHSIAYSALVMCAAQLQHTFGPAAQCSKTQSIVNGFYILSSRCLRRRSSFFSFSALPLPTFVLICSSELSEHPKPHGRPSEVSYRGFQISGTKAATR